MGKFDPTVPVRPDDTRTPEERLLDREAVGMAKAGVDCMTEYSLRYFREWVLGDAEARKHNIGASKVLSDD